MKNSLDQKSQDLIFSQARTHHVWTSEEVSDELLMQIYELAKWGPTALNANPLRIMFLKSAAQKEKLIPALSGSNVGQVQAAPVTAILAWDQKFFDHLPTLFPAYDARLMFASNPVAAESTAFRNSSMQGAYFMIAARALGLDVGPMSGFDNAKVDQIFFKENGWRSNFLVNLGYADHSKVFPRGARLPFSQAAVIL